MSLKTWKKKYYNIDASDVETEMEAIDHSILKWSGFMPKALKKHNVEVAGSKLYDIKNNELFYINSGTCALCCLFDDGGCSDCPFKIVHGKTCCEDDFSPYMVFCETGNPEPMIEALVKVKEAYDISTQ